MSDQHRFFTPGQLEKAQKDMIETKLTAEKAEDILRKSALSLVEAKKSIILALLEEDVDIHIISESTKTPLDRVVELRASIKK
ncbi:hypothetical protein AAGS61_13870 [Lysinibacillus sp. KU-BSD001]|uniref:hypothetical protein n=1 Tax=Lysinibacillus sp. KU-BSD001 TaxID=3141328 RepID=UPI0036EDDC9D